MQHAFYGIVFLGPCTRPPTKGWAVPQRKSKCQLLLRNPGGENENGVCLCVCSGMRWARVFSWWRVVRPNSKAWSCLSGFASVGLATLASKRQARSKMGHWLFRHPKSTLRVIIFELFSVYFPFIIPRILVTSLTVTPDTAPEKIYK